MENDEKIPVERQEAREIKAPEPVHTPPPQILRSPIRRGADRDPNVDRPDHYNKTKYEAWDVLDEWFHDDPLIWNVVKYLQRAPHKGRHLEDLKKARAYLERRIEAFKK